MRCWLRAESQGATMPITPRRGLAILAAPLSLIACSQSFDPAADSASALTPDATPKPVIDSLNGDVTAHEVSTFLAAASAAAIPTSQYPNGSHNYLADGNGGTALEGINRMVEVT